MVLGKVLFPCAQHSIFECLVHKLEPMPGHDKLPDLHLCVGNGASRDASIRGPVKPPIQDILAPADDYSLAGVDIQ